MTVEGAGEKTKHFLSRTNCRRSVRRSKTLLETLFSSKFQAVFYFLLLLRLQFARGQFSPFSRSKKKN